MYTAKKIISETDVFHKTESEKLVKNLEMFGTNIRFEDDIWKCDLMKRSEVHTDDTDIYLGKIPSKYIEYAKYYAITRLTKGISVGAINNDLKGVRRLTKFLTLNDIDILKINNNVERGYYEYLNGLKFKGRPLSETYKHSLWSYAKEFLKFVSGWENVMPLFKLKTENPYTKATKKDYKYIPAKVIDRLDEVFKFDTIPDYLILFYWIARSVPSRATEVLGMKLDCLKPYGENTWVVIIPTWKQNGGYKEPQIRRIYINYTGHGKYIVDLIKKQQEFVKSIQDKLPDNMKGYLFTIHPFKFMNNRYKFKGIIDYYIYKDKFMIPDRNALKRHLNHICKLHQVKDKNDNIYKVTSHQLRHNGITDRIYAGFTPLQIMLQTEHQNDAMILKSYTHIQNKELINKQREVNGEGNLKEELPVMFRGRILNMDEKTEERLLRNKRAYKIKDLGICSDITGCSNNIFECLSCDYFVPDADNLEYFKQQVIYWEERVVLYGKNLSLKENAEYNLELHKQIVDRIETAIVS